MPETLYNQHSLPDHEPQDFTDNGRCVECGNCCSNYLPLTPSDIRRIRGYIKQHNIKPVQHVPVNVLATANIDLTCPFLNDTKPTHKCSIYSVRPEICRAFTCHTINNPELEKQIIKETVFRIGRKNAENMIKCNMRETFFK